MGTGQKGVITRIVGGHGRQRHLRAIGIREGKRVRILTKQPARGPLVIEIDGSQIAIGRGMAAGVLVEI